MQALLIGYSDSSFNSLRSNLINLSEDCSMELVHNIRLNIKKIRALLDALDYRDNSSNYILIMKKVNSLFARLGYLRDAQVQVSLLEFYRERVGEEVDDIIDNINKRKKKINSNLKKKIRKLNPFDITLLNQRFDETIECLDNENLEEKFQRKVEQGFNQVIELISDSTDEDVLHRIRILLKELTFNLSIMKKAKVKTKYNSTFSVLLNSIHKKLGNWHDLFVFLSLINEIDDCCGRAINLLQIVESDKGLIHQEIVEDLKKLRGIKPKKTKRGDI
ncbi:MAG: CHAD domain-containing protein [Bacteroidales bacterium]|nr:CHAD domain-containing protein [Bacteroidales bacterium]